MGDSFCTTPPDQSHGANFINYCMHDPIDTQLIIFPKLYFFFSKYKSNNYWNISVISFHGKSYSVSDISSSKIINLSIDVMDSINK